MNRLKKVALLLEMQEKLRKEGSWCGETHIQKAMYMCQELLGLPTGFAYVLYKHGPFSFDLRGELGALEADGLLALEAQRPCGGKLTVTDLGKKFIGKFPKTIRRQAKTLDFVAEYIGNSGVVELERLATALYVIQEKGNGRSRRARAKRLTQLKPHVSYSQSQHAITEVRNIQKRAKALRTKSP